MTVKTKKRKSCGRTHKKNTKSNGLSVGEYKLYTGKTYSPTLLQRGVINSMIIGNTFNINFPTLGVLQSLMNTHSDNPEIEPSADVVRIWDLADGTLLNSIGFVKEKYLMELVERSDDDMLLARKFLQETGMVVRWSVQLNIHMYERNMNMTHEEFLNEQKRLADLTQDQIYDFVVTRKDRNYGTNILEFDLPATPLWVYGVDEIEGVEYDNIQMMRTDGKMVKGEEYMKNPITFLEKCLNVVGESLSDEAYENYEICGLEIQAKVKGL